MIETVQELQTPSIVLNTRTDFEKTLKVLKTYTETIAIIKQHDTDAIILPKIIKGEKIDILNRVHLYFSLYDGKTRPVDKEAQGILYYKLDDLIDEMKQFPHMFTSDLHILVKRYEKDMREFIRYVAEMQE